MAALICCCFNMAFIFASVSTKRDFFHPVRLLNMMWLAVNFMNFLLGWNSNELEYLILILPPLMFSIGFFVAEKTQIVNFQKKKEINSYSLVSIKSFFSSGMLVFILIVFAFYSYSFVSKLGFSGILSNWYSIRVINWTDNVEENIFFKYTAVLTFAFPSILLISAQCSKKKSEYLKFVVSLGIALIWSFFRTSRTSTFTVVIILAMSQLMLLGDKEKLSKSVEEEMGKVRKKKRKLFLFAVIFIIVMFIYIALQKNPAIYGNVSNFEFFIKSLSNYSNLSAAAFVEWYKNGFVYAKGSQSLRFFIAIFNKLGFSAVEATPNSGGQFYYYEGLSTNALTVAKAYIEDFGILYMAFMMLLFGVIHGAVYKHARNSAGLLKVRYSLINAMLDIPLFYQILTNQYLNVLSAWIQYVIWFCVFSSSIVWNKRYND